MIDPTLIAWLEHNAESLRAVSADFKKAASRMKIKIYSCYEEFHVLSPEQPVSLSLALDRG